VYTPL